MTNIKVLKEEAWETYNLLRKKRLYCPAFGEDVIISLRGWYHIINPVNRSRSTADVKRRFKLLKHVEEMIVKSHTVQNIKTRKGITYYTLEAVLMVDWSSSKALKKLSVVIMDTKAGKTFYSIMDKNIVDR